MLRTRPPRSTPEEARARLACIRHAASVDPEPGSNSPPMPPKAAACSCWWPRDNRALLHALAAVLVASESVLASGHPTRIPARARLRSLRLRHTTNLATALPCGNPLPSVRCASLSTCSPRRRDTHRLGRSGIAASTPPHPAARTTSGVAPLRARRAYRTAHAPCQGLGHSDVALCVPSEATRLKERSPVSRRRSTPHPITCRGTPSVLPRH